MKNNRLPLYLVFVLIGLGIVYRITNPPAPVVPGPLGGISTWRSTVAVGKMTGHAVNAAGSKWAGAWTETEKSGKVSSAVWIIDFNAYSAKPCLSPKDVCADYITWADDNTIRLICSSDSAKEKGPGVVLIDAKSCKVKSSAQFVSGASRIIYWPNNSNLFIAEVAKSGEKAAIAVYDTKGGKYGVIGKQVSFDMPKGGEFYADAGISVDGSSFVFSLVDPTAKDGRSYWLADTKTGTAAKMFDLAAVPGKIEGIWPSSGAVLIVCKVGKKYECTMYDPATGKIARLKSGAGDLAKWPNAPKTLSYTTLDGGYSFNLATGKIKTLFDLRKKDSYSDKNLRDIISISRLYKLENGKYVTISETAGAIDIRELKPNGLLSRSVLPR